MEYSLFCDDSVPSLIFRVAEIQYLTANRVLKKYNITLEQGILLYAIKYNEYISQKDLSELTFKDQANTTRILKRLIQKELVKIEPSKKDRRMNLVQLTERGEELIDTIIPCIEETTSLVSNHYTKEELIKFKEFLIKYYNIYDEYSKSLV